MALSKSPRRRKAAAPSPDVPISPDRHRKSVSTRTATSKGKAKAGSARPYRSLTVDIPTAPSLCNFLAPLGSVVAEHVSSIGKAQVAAAGCIICKAPSQLTSGCKCRTLMLELFQHLQPRHRPVVWPMLVCREAPTALTKSLHQGRYLFGNNPARLADLIMCTMIMLMAIQVPRHAWKSALPY